MFDSLEEAICYYNNYNYVTDTGESSDNTKAFKHSMSECYV